MLRAATYAILAIGLALPPQPACAQSQNSDLHIGLLLDSEPRDTDSGSDLDFLREEIHKVLGAGRSVHFLPEHLRFGAERADYLSLANDPAVDLVIAVGPASAAMLAALGDLPKPTIAVGVLDVELQGMPLAEPGVSGVPNFTYVLGTHPMEGPGGVPPHPSFFPSGRHRQRDPERQAGFRGFLPTPRRPSGSRGGAGFLGTGSTPAGAGRLSRRGIPDDGVRAQSRGGRHPGRGPCRAQAAFLCHEPVSCGCGDHGLYGRPERPGPDRPQPRPDRRGSRPGGGAGGDARASATSTTSGC